MIQPVKEKIILGIDPGTTIMGYGVLRVKGTKPEMIAMGIIDLRKSIIPIAIISGLVPFTRKTPYPMMVVPGSIPKIIFSFTG